MYMTNPIVIHSMKTINPWGDYSRILFYKVVIMNFYEWKSGAKYDGKYTWRNKAKQIQKSLWYNKDPNANVIHHLRDTEEQRKYNDEHYELWGHNLDGTFEYGKYVIFVTPKEHAAIHMRSEETRKKMSVSLKKTFSTEEQKLKRSKQRKSEWTDERKQEYSKRFSGEKSINYGRKASDETRRRLSESHKGIKPSKETVLKRSNSLKEYRRLNPFTKETCDKISKAISGKNNPNYGKVYTDDEKDYLRRKSKTSRDAAKVLYSSYKHHGGILQWNAFQAAIKKGDIAFEEFATSVYINIFETKQQDIDLPKKTPFKVTKDKAAMYKLYRRQGGELKWNDFQSAYNKGEIHLNLINTGDEPVQIKTGEKLVQFMHLPVLHTAFQEVLSEDFEKLKPDSVRGSGGFGSSGIN